MSAAIALIAAIAFVAVALYRLAAPGPAPVRHVQLALALVAGVFGIIWWRASGDTRWLVGGVLLIGAAVPGWVAGNRRGVAIAALILGVLGTALFGIATAKPIVSLVQAA